MATDSKGKLLVSAFEEFAKNGFWGASTRDIAAKANINISSILYYFGGKKGLYAASLEKIVDVVNSMTLDLTARYQDITDKTTPEEARTLLKQALERFLLILCSKEISFDMKKVFLTEYSNPTEEFNILYNKLIRPVHDRMANVLHLASEKKITIKDCYFHIITLFSQLFVFASRKESFCSLMEWPDYDATVIRKLSNYTDQQIDFILDHLKN